MRSDSAPRQDDPPEVVALLHALTRGARAALGDNLVGMYLRGSLALGDFDPATSDVDFFAITERAVVFEEFARLAALHASLARLPNPYSDQLEGAYVERDAAWRYEPGRRFPTIGRGESLEWAEHRANWVIERWTVREHGAPLDGPDPRALIAPVSREDIRRAVRARLPDWADWARRPDDPAWRSHRGHKAYVVETLCRALYTLATGDLPSKARAVAWALANVPAPWRETVVRSRAWRGDSSLDGSMNAEVQRFVLWACAQGDLPGGAPPSADVT